MSSGIIDTAKGRIKEAAGALVGDDGLKREGQADQLIGKTKDAAEKVIDKTSEVAEKVAAKASELTASTPAAKS